MSIKDFFLTAKILGFPSINELTSNVAEATAAKMAAESARDAALIQSGVYATEALGRAAVADGQAFKVQGSGDVAAYEYRRVNSGSSTLIATYPSKLAYEKQKVFVASSYSRKDTGKNLCNPNDPNIIVGSFLDADGSLRAYASFSITGFIAISQGQTLYCSYNSGGAYNCLYDDSFNVVGSYQFNNSLTGTAASKYARFTVGTTNLSGVQIEIGSVGTQVVPYTESYTLFSAIMAAQNAAAYRVPKRPGVNLCDPNDAAAVTGKYLDGDGSYRTLAGYSVTGYIPITNGQSLTCNMGSGGAHNLLYDANRNLIGGSANNTTLTGTAASAFARFSVPTGNLALVQVENGSSFSSFVAYNEYQPLADLAASTSSSLVKKLDKVIGKNLFNPNDPDILTGYFIQSNGSFAATTYGLNISGKIPISAGQTLKANFSVGNTYVALYSANGTYIAGSAVNSNSITYATGAAYARFSYYTPWNNYQIEVGSVSTTYEPYTEYGPIANVAKQVPDFETVTVLPAKMYFVKDFESTIYYENVLFKNLADPAQVYFSEGVNYNRQAKMQFPTAVTGSTMTAQVLRSFKRGELKTITYDVKDATTNSGKTVNILFVGDSFTDIGTWNKRVTSLLTGNGVTVREIGTTGNATFKAEGLSGGNIGNTFLNASAGVARIVNVTGVSVVPETGYPGPVYKDANNAQWTIRGGKVDGSGNGKLVVTKFGAVAGDFASFPSSGTLTKLSGVGDATISYSNPVAAYFNPFINHSTGLLDITSYISFWGFNTPNVVVFQFTWNDTGEWSSDSSLASVVANFKSAADHVHAAFPSAKVVFSVEPFGSYNADRDFNGKKYAVLRLMQLMLAAFESDAAYSGWVKIAPSYAFVDLVYGYASSTVAPCSKYPSVTEQSGGDGVHPRTEGMEQIGECVYQVVSNII